MKRLERILIVEDDPGVAELQQMRLQRAGFTTLTASNATQVREYVANNAVDLIILDYLLPGNVNGLELHSQLKSAGHDVPVILVTGYGNEALAIQALRTGVRDFVSKSLEYLDYLPEAVGRVLYQVRMERELQESENRFRNLLLSAPDAILVSNKDGRLVFVNQMAEKMFGFVSADLVNQSDELLVPERFRTAHREHRQRFAADPAIWPAGTRLRQLAVRRDGTEFPIEIGLSLIEFEKEELVLANVTDVTKVQHLENLQRESHQVLEQIAHRQPLNAVLTTLTTAIERSHPGLLCSIMILDAEGQRLHVAVAPSLPPGYLQAIEGLQIGQDAGSCGAAAFLRCRVVVEDIAHHPNWEKYRGLASEFGLGACWAEPIVGPTGEVLGTLAMYYPTPRSPSAVELDTISRAAQLAAIALEQKRQADALRSKEAQLRQAQKMEAVGALAGGIAHEFNNLLQVIRGYTEFASDTIGSEHAAGKDLGFVMDASQRAMNLTRQLLYFGRRQPLERATVDPKPMIRDLMQLLRPLIGENIEVQTSYGAIRGAIHIDPDQFQQALMNLCINSRDAMPLGGTLSVSTEQVSLSPEFCETHRHPTPGDTVLITVTDTGIGMSEDVLGRIFEPFFTTKEVGKGTGLGMAMVYGMVDQHGGSIQVESQLGRGTTVRLYLPLVEPQVTGAHPPAPHHKPHGNQTILISEDEPLVASYARRVLEQAGYRTLIARDGIETVETFKRDADKIALVLLDVVMPKLTGHQVCEQIRAIKPDLPIVFCTGYDPESSLTGYVGQRSELLITKPYSSQDLLTTIGDALEAVATQ